MSQFELFELILLLKLDKQLPVERFEATVTIPVNSILPPSSLSGVVARAARLRRSEDQQATESLYRGSFSSYKRRADLLV